MSRTIDACKYGKSNHIRTMLIYNRACIINYVVSSCDKVARSYKACRNIKRRRIKLSPSVCGELWRFYCMRPCHWPTPPGVNITSEVHRCKQPPALQLQQLFTFPAVTTILSAGYCLQHKDSLPRTPYRISRCRHRSSIQRLLAQDLAAEPWRIQELKGPSER